MERETRFMNHENKLKYYRAKQGLSQSDVAEKLNISRQSISNWENSKTAPDLNSLKALSKLYKASIDELLNHSYTNTVHNPFKHFSKFTLESILVFIVSVLFLFTFFITAPYGIIGAVVLLVYNNKRIKSKLIVTLCLLIVIFNVLYIITILLL